MRYICFIFFFFQLFGSYSQSTFEFLIKTDRDENPGDVIEDALGNYFLVGKRVQWEPLEKKGLLVKISSDGKILDEREFGNSDTAVIFSAIYNFLNDSIIILGGSGESTSTKILMLKSDNNLNSFIQNDFVIPPDNIIGDLHSLINSKNEIIISGMSYNTETLQDLFLYKISIDGDSLGSVFYPLDNMQWAYDILELKGDIGYKVFAFGIFKSSLSVSNIIKLDTDFNILAIDSLPHNLNQNNCAEWLSDTTYLITGKCDYLNSRNMGLLELDTSNLLLNEFFADLNHDTIVFPGVYQNVDFLSKDNIYFGGTFNVIPNHVPYQDEPSWIELCNLDSNLNLKWKRYYGGDAFYFLWSLKATHDGGCIMVSHRYDHNVQYQECDIHVLKVDENGLVTSVPEDKNFKVSEVILYPNPGKDIVHVSTALQDLLLTFYDMNGRAVFQKAITQDEMTLNVTGISPGTYLYVFSKKGEKVEEGKWVKE